MQPVAIIAVVVCMAILPRANYNFWGLEEEEEEEEEEFHAANLVT